MNGKMKSAVKGLMMGCCGKPLPLSTAKKEPIAYSYNGVVLPELPPDGDGGYGYWDRETFPFAIMDYYSSANKLFVFSVRPSYIPSEGCFLFPTEGKYKIFSVSSGSWYNTGNMTNTIKPGSTTSTFNDLFWSNFDILYENGSVYFKASDPIPVYE